MNNRFFRQKSIDRINSPESLNDYVKVTNPSLWFILAGVLALMIGVFAWAAFGKIDTNIYVAAEAKSGGIMLYVDETEIDKISVGMSVTIADARCTVEAIADRPVKAVEVDEYVLHKGNMEASMWVYPVSVVGTVQDGVYMAAITVEQTSPMSFVFN